MALGDVVVPPSVLNWSGGRSVMHWNMVGNEEWWIKVLVDLESNKTLSILFVGWVPMVLHMAIIHNGNLGGSEVNTCGLGTDVW